MVKRSTCLILATTTGLRVRLVIVFKFMVDTKWRKRANSPASAVDSAKNLKSKNWINDLDFSNNINGF